MGAGECREFRGMCRKQILTRDVVLVQENPHKALPQGLKVVNTLAPTIGHLPRVKVLVQNMSGRGISVRPCDLSAELCIVEREAPIDHVQESVRSYLQGVNAQNIVQEQGGLTNHETCGDDDFLNACRLQESSLSHEFRV